MSRHALTASVPGTGNRPDETGIRAQLDRILASPLLGRSERRRAFLRFIVEEALAGRADRLKGFTIAFEVFGRDETFDAKSDPAVRLEARRLRRDLDSYYAGPGSDDPVRISMPTGAYIPYFEWVGQPRALIPPDADPDVSQTLSTTGSAGHGGSTRLNVAMISLTAVALAAVAAWVLVSREPGSGRAVGKTLEPTVLVMPFKARSSSDNARYLAAGISEELIRDLMRFPAFRLYAVPPSASETVEPVDLWREPDAAYVVEGSVRTEGQAVRVASRVSNANTGQVLWSGSFDRPLTADALLAVQADLSGEIATVLGQPYGVLQDDLRRAAASTRVSSIESYVCVLRAYDYRRSFSREKFDGTMACLEDAVRRDPDYADAWAMLGWLHLDAGRFEFAGSDNVQAEYDAGLQAAARAAELDPDSVLALKALSSINHYLGRYTESERLARRAVELNPYDPDTLAQLGWRLAVRGKFEEGIPLLEQAIDRTVHAPGWYYHLVAIDLYLNGAYDEALAVAERSAVDGSGISQALIASAAAELGDDEKAASALTKLADAGPMACDPSRILQRHGATDAIVEAISNGLDRARQNTASAVRAEDRRCSS